MNTGVYVSFSTMVSSGYMPCCGIAGSYDRFIPTFKRNLHTDFHSGCTSLHSHQQRKSVPLTPHLPQHLMFVDFLIMGIMTSVRWRFIAVFIWFSLVMSDVEHLFRFLLAICTFSLKKWWFRSAHCLAGLLFFWYWVAWALCMFLKVILCQLFHLPLFSAILGVAFSPCL